MAQAVTRAHAEAQASAQAAASAFAQAQSASDAMSAAVAQAVVQVLARAQAAAEAAAVAQAVASASAQAQAQAQAAGPGAAYAQVYAQAEASSAAEVLAHAQACAQAAAQAQAEAHASACAEARVAASAYARACAAALAQAQAIAQACAQAAATASTSVDVIPSIQTSVQAFIDPNCRRPTCEQYAPTQPSCPPAREYTWDFGEVPVGTHTFTARSIPADILSKIKSAGIVKTTKLSSNLPSGVELTLDLNSGVGVLLGNFPTAGRSYEVVFGLYDARNCEIYRLTVTLRTAQARAAPLTVEIVRVAVDRACEKDYSHVLTVYWQASGGTAPIAVGPLF